MVFWCYLELVPRLFLTENSTLVALVDLEAAVQEIFVHFEWEYFPVLGFYSEPLLLVPWIYLVTLVSCWMVLMSTPNCSIKVLTTSFKLALDVVNFSTMS